MGCGSSKQTHVLPDDGAADCDPGNQTAESAPEASAPAPSSRKTSAPAAAVPPAQAGGGAEDDEDDEIEGPEVDVKGENLKAAVNEVLPSMPKCVILLMKNFEDLKEIPADFKGKSGSVRKLDISKTGINSLTSVVETFPNLEELIIHEIPALITDDFILPLLKLPSLKSLQLSKASNMGKLPTSLLGLKLKKLGLNGCTALKTVKELSGMSTLKSLELSEIPATGDGAEVKAVVESVPTTLTQLLLYGNKMKNLPASVGALASLTDLNLYNNTMMKFPDELATLTALTELNVSSNRLMQIPVEVLTKLPNLKRLAAFWNNIVMCPSVVPLAALTTLELNGNKLEALPEFGHHLHLTSINFADNRIGEIKEDFFSAAKFPKLDTIEMGKNKLKALPASIGTLPSLVKINFADNELESLPPQLFDGGKLLTLMLSDNKLSVIPDEIVKIKDALFNILLDRNNLAKLPECLKDFPNLTKVQLKRNPVKTADPVVVAMEKMVNTKGAEKRWVGP